MRQAILLLLSLTPFVAQAGSVNVCTDADGNKTFQSMPCAQGTKADVKIIETTAPSTHTVYDPSAKTAAYNKMRADNERRQLDRDIRRTENKIVDYRNKMQRELSLLRKKKSFANNNLAGAEWENSISTEMQAVTSKYSTLIAAEESKLANLRQQAIAN